MTENPQAPKLPYNDREQRLADNLLRLKKEHPGRPVVAWLGMLHADKQAPILGVDSVAKRIAQSPEFVNGAKKLGTVFVDEYDGMPGLGSWSDSWIPPRT